MAIKDVLAIVEPGERAASLLEVAASLALRQGAHLTGLCVVPPLMLSEAGLPWAGGPVEAAALDQVRASLHGTHAAAVQQLEAAFRKAAADLVAPTEWRTAEGRPAELAPLHARYADLTVVGQQDPENPVEAGAGVIEALLLGSGRPVLIVPYAGRFAAVGRTVLVAWNASREAARAVNDALPLLEQADAVKVLAVNPGRSGDEEPPPATRPVFGIQGDGAWPAADIAHHLARHGVKADASYTISDEVDIGNTILSRAADLGVDLIVMGGYGHSRAREWILGGATRTILGSMTVPVLMSH
ncbi:MAG TPA: universal stress protein [Stellaceae bacterium]|nr:universal stress protein [Stellaceae bacterium]